MRRVLLSVVLLLFLAPVTAYAGTRCAARKAATVLRNPDARTSITLTAGLGEANKGVHDGDVTVFGAALTYPASRNFSFLARWDHSELDWDSAHDTDTSVFSVGLKFYLP